MEKQHCTSLPSVVHLDVALEGRKVKFSQPALTKEIKSTRNRHCTSGRDLYRAAALFWESRAQH